MGSLHSAGHTKVSQPLHTYLVLELLSYAIGPFHGGVEGQPGVPDVDCVQQRSEEEALVLVLFVEGLLELGCDLEVLGHVRAQNGVGDVGFDFLLGLGVHAVEQPEFVDHMVHLVGVVVFERRLHIVDFRIYVVHSVAVEVIPADCVG